MRIKMALHVQVCVPEGSDEVQDSFANAVSPKNLSEAADSISAVPLLDRLHEEFSVKDPGQIFFQVLGHVIFLVIAQFIDGRGIQGRIRVQPREDHQLQGCFSGQRFQGDWSLHFCRESRQCLWIVHFAFGPFREGGVKVSGEFSQAIQSKVSTSREEKIYGNLREKTIVMLLARRLSD